MKKTIATTAIAFAALLANAIITGEYNTWLGYRAGEDATGNRATVQGAGAGGGAQDLYRTDLIGAAAGVYGCRFYDTVGIGYRALRQSDDVSNTVAIGSHAFEGVSMGGITDATWINGHFVANPPKYNGSWWQQTPGEFYITGDASLTNGLAPIWYDGTNLHLRGYTAGGGGIPATYDPNVGGLVVTTNVYFGYGTEAAEYSFFRSVGFNEEVFLGPSAMFHVVEDASIDIYNADGLTIGYTNVHDYVQGVLGTALSGKTFDLSTDTGLRAAVSNIVILLGGTIHVTH